MSLEVWKGFHDKVAVVATEIVEEYWDFLDGLQLSIAAIVGSSAKSPSDVIVVLHLDADIHNVVSSSAPCGAANLKWIRVNVWYLFQFGVVVVEGLFADMTEVSLRETFLGIQIENHPRGVLEIVDALFLQLNHLVNEPLVAVLSRVRLVWRVEARYEAYQLEPN